MSNRLDLISSAGRIVAGNVSKANPLDMNGKPRTKPQYFFALAIAKNDPAVGPLMQQMYQFASQQYSQYADVTRRIQLGLAPGTQFAWKIDDGDSAKLKDRPGHAGCWIFKFSTTIAPKAVDRNNQMIDPVHVKTGYYADVAFSVSANGKVDHTAGLYVNPNFVRLLGYGEEIVAGPTAEQRFGAAPAPQMGSAAPIAPAGAPGGFPGAGQQPAAGGGMATGFPGVGGNPAHNAPAAPAGTMAGGVAPSLPGFGGHMTPPPPAATGNGFPASAPGVPDGATAAPAGFTGAGQASMTVSHSSVPGFAHGGVQA